MTKDKMKRFMRFMEKQSVGKTFRVRPWDDSILNNHSWREFVETFESIGPASMLIFNPADFGRTAFALKRLLWGALNWRKYSDPDPTPATIRQRRDGTIVVAWSRRVLVRQVP